MRLKKVTLHPSVTAKLYRFRRLASMLDNVALNQTRFNTPGVAPDNRGILLGKQGALLFSSVDRLVGFFRVFCDESSMDDLLPKLKIVQVRTPLESREFLVFFHASTSYLLDRA